MPSSFLFGFGASTGGLNDFHEITCFQATPANQSSSSASVNVQETGELQTSSQVFLAYYSPENWWGRLTAQQINVTSSTGAVTVNPEVNWDAACVLTGGACGSTYNTKGGYAQPASSTAPQSWSKLPALTWSGSAGTSFTWNNGITTTEQGWLNGNGASTGNGQYLLHYLKGDTNHDVSGYNSTVSGPQFRTRTEILGDIINSSPTWIGGPDEGLPAQFSNAINPSIATTLNGEIGTTNTYPAFANAKSDRLNVVYVGANDGMLHGFAAGSYNSDGSFNSQYNTGQEVLAYVPYAVLQSFNSEINTANDYAYPRYGHNFYVNATPATGDVFYGGNWHTLLVGGLGTGGRGLYALNVTNPYYPNSSGSSNTAPVPADVLADYTFANHGLVPSNATTPTPPGWEGVNVNTGTNSYAATMGDISGKPIIRLMNNGDFAVISGNGTNSDDGEAGIFFFLINPKTGFSKTIFLGTGTGNSNSPDGIDYVSSADLNGDHFVDYLYAGDKDGNVWRFNVTGDQSSDWHVSYYGNGTTPTPLFKTGSSSDPQPITTRILVDTAIAPNGNPQVMLQFGTGQTTPFTNGSSASYATTPQAIYDVWDGGMSAWNSLTGATRYNAWSSSNAPTLPLRPNNLAENTISSPGTVAGQTAYANNAAGSTVNAVTLTSAPVCWGAANGGTCTSTNIQYGSYEDLPQAPTNGQAQYQQVTYNPAFIQGAAVFDTTIPPYVDAYDCNNGLQGGYTYAFNPLTGGAIANGFFRSSGTNGAAITLGGVVVSGLQLNATGSPTVVSANGNPVMVQQTVSGNPVATEVFPAGGMGSQVNWIELR